jgi:hypothetical protein
MSRGEDCEMRMGKAYYERAKELHNLALCGCWLTKAEAEMVLAAQVNYHWRRVVPLTR